MISSLHNLKDTALPDSETTYYLFQKKTENLKEVCSELAHQPQGIGARPIIQNWHHGIAYHNKRLAMICRTNIRDALNEQKNIALLKMDALDYCLGRGCYAEEATDLYYNIHYHIERFYDIHDVLPSHAYSLKAWHKFIAHIQEITRLYIPFVQRIAFKYSDYLGLDNEEAFQVGILGLIKAIYRYKPEEGLDFDKFAYSIIFSMLKRSPRHHSHTEKSQEENYMHKKRYDDLTNAYYARHGEMPDPSWVKNKIGLSDQQFSNFEQQMSLHVSSLSDGLDYESPHHDVKHDTVLWEKLYGYIEELPDLMRQCVACYFEINNAPSKEKFMLLTGLSQYKMNILVQKGMSILKEKLKDHKMDDFESL
jgi:RNA polymerase sigma factor (sigma-70 family)